MVTVQVGRKMAADLAELGWLTAPDRINRDALTLALAGLIGQAIVTRLAPSLRITPEPTTIGLDESDGLSPNLIFSVEEVGPHDLGLGLVQSGEALGEADLVADIVKDKPAEGQVRVDASPIAVERAELSYLEPYEAQPLAETPQSFDEHAAWLWGRRLTLWHRWKIWAPDWGPRPDQDGCLAPDDFL